MNGIIVLFEYCEGFYSLKTSFTLIIIISYFNIAVFFHMYNTKTKTCTVGSRSNRIRTSKDE